MRFMKIFTCFCIMILICSTCFAADKKPLRLARLPIIFQSNQPDYNTCVTLETKIARAVNIPMNGTLKLVEQIDMNESTSALNTIWQNMRVANKKSKLKDAIKPLAEKLNADIVVCPVLRRYSETYVQTNRSLESHLVSNVSATLIVYDRRTDNLVEKNFSKHFNDSASGFGKASYLAGECFDKLIDETNLRRTFMSIK